MFRFAPLSRASLVFALLVISPALISAQPPPPGSTPSGGNPPALPSENPPASAIPYWSEVHKPLPVSQAEIGLAVQGHLFGTSGVSPSPHFVNSHPQFGHQPHVYHQPNAFPGHAHGPVLHPPVLHHPGGNCCGHNAFPPYYAREESRTPMRIGVGLGRRALINLQIGPSIFVTKYGSSSSSPLPGFYYTPVFRHRPYSYR